MTPLMLGLALTLAAPGPKEAPKKDAPTIVGEWTLDTVVVGGKPEKMEACTVFTLTAGGKCTMREGKDDKPEEMAYTIDPKMDPAHFDLREPGMKGELIRGIYKLDKDTLTVCLSLMGDRPTAFASPVNSTTILITLKRVKKD